MEGLYLNKKIPVISIVATKSGTGKTTLIEKLIKIFKSKGYSVGALKHDAHRFEIDKKGKDSWRFSNAGADNVIISSLEKLAMIKRTENETKIEEILPLFDGMDIVIMEGFKSNKYPKIEVHRRDVDDKLLCRDNRFDKSTFLAVATDEKIEDMLNLDINNIESIAIFIEENIIKY